MLRMTPELAEILGLLCAEGSHIVAYSDYWETYKGKKRFRKNKKSERIEFYNKDEKLLLHYQKLLQKQFAYRANVTKHGKINIGKNEIIRKIIRFTELGHLKWKIPCQILNSNETSKIAFIRGFFDGDGTASGMIRFFSTNENGLKQVSKLLFDVGFPNKFHGPFIREGRKPHYIIRISRKEKERFLNRIKPVSKRPVYVGIISKKPLNIP